MKIYRMSNDTHQERVPDIDRLVGKDVWIMIGYMNDSWWVKLLDIIYKDEHWSDTPVKLYKTYAMRVRHYGPMDLPTESLEEACTNTMNIADDAITLWIPLEVLTTDELFGNGYEYEL